MAVTTALLFGMTTLGITYQDFSRRAIHVVLVLLLFALAVLDAVMQLRSATDMVFSAVFLAVVLSFLIGYLRIRFGHWVNPLKAHLGLGDVLFFVAVIPLFSQHGYLWFFISGLLLCVVVYGLFSSLIGKDSIPLAGMLSVYLLGLKIIESQFGFSMFNLNPVF